MSVVGFNDMPFMDKVSPPMTTVRIPHYELGAEAARLLLEVLHDPARHPRSLLLPLTMVVRSSTGPVPQAATAPDRLAPTQLQPFAVLGPPGLRDRPRPRARMVRY